MTLEEIKKAEKIRLNKDEMKNAVIGLLIRNLAFYVGDDMNTRHIYKDKVNDKKYYQVEIDIPYKEKQKIKNKIIVPMYYRLFEVLRFNDDTMVYKYKLDKFKIVSDNSNNVTHILDNIYRYDTRLITFIENTNYLFFNTDKFIYDGRVKRILFPENFKRKVLSKNLNHHYYDLFFNYYKNNMNQLKSAVMKYYSSICKAYNLEIKNSDNRELRYMFTPLNTSIKIDESEYQFRLYHPIYLYKLLSTPKGRNVVANEIKKNMDLFCLSIIKHDMFDESDISITKQGEDILQDILLIDGEPKE